MINYEQEVKKKYSDAKCIGVGLGNSNPSWYMIIGCRIGENYKDSKQSAWQSAYEKLKKEGKI